MKKPLLITYEYPPDIGGVANYLKQEVVFYNKSFGVNPVVFKVKDSRFLKWIPFFWKTKILFKKNNCDYLWISHILPIGYVALLLKKIFKIKYRLYAHGLDIVLAKRNRHKKFLAKKIIKNADEIISNSQATANLFLDFGIDLKKIKISYPRIERVEVGKYVELGIKLKDSNNLADKFLILSIGRLVKRKGIDLVIKSLPRAMKKVPNIFYAIIGEGEEKENLKKLCLEIFASKENPVLFLGGVSDEEKYGWLSACDCFVLTPIEDKNDFEGYGIVYKEAEMFGKPVVGSRIGGVPEAIGNKGTLVSPGSIDEISEAILNIFMKKS